MRTGKLENAGIGVRMRIFLVCTRPIYMVIGAPKGEWDDTWEVAVRKKHGSKGVTQLITKFESKKTYPFQSS